MKLIFTKSADIMKRKCLYCKEGLRGRIDKKFCDDYCRNTYNNVLKSDEDKLLKQINHILRKNWKILRQFEQCSMTKVEVIALIRQGFEFRFHTHGLVLHGKNYFFCYEIGFTFLDEFTVEITKHGHTD